MADLGWLETLEENFLNIDAISEIYFNKDRFGELNFIFAGSTNNNHYKLFDLPHVGDVVSTSLGNVTMTFEDAAKLLEATAVVLTNHNIITNDQLKDALILALGNF